MKYFSLLTALLLNIFAIGGESPFFDSQLSKWAELFNLGKHAELQQELKKNINSAKPHPFASYIWSKECAVMNQPISTNKGLPEFMSFAPAAYSYNENNNYAGIAAFLSDPKQISSCTDYYALQSAFWACGDLGVDPSTQLSIVIRIQQVFPGQYRNLWNILMLAESSDSAYRMVMNKKDLFIGEPEWQSFKAEVLQSPRPWHRLTIMNFMEGYLEKHPDDINAHRRLSTYYAENEQYAEACIHIKEAIRIFPFQQSWFNSLLEYSLFIQSELSVQNMVRRFSASYFPLDTALGYYSMMTKALSDNGNPGRARILLREGLKKYPGNASLNYTLGSIETDVKRFRHALPYLLTAVQNNPENLDYIELYIDVLRLNKDYEKATLESQKYLNKGECLSYDLYNVYAILEYDKLNYSEAIRLRKQYDKKFPFKLHNLRWLNLTLLKEKRFGESEKISWNYFRTDVPPTDLLAALRDNWTSSAYNNFLDSCMHKYSWNYASWFMKAKTLSSFSDKKSLYEKAVRLNPARMWPLVYLRYEADGLEEYQTVNQMVIGLSDVILDSGQKNDIVDYYYERAGFFQDKSYLVALTGSERTSALRFLDNYLAKGGKPSSYHYDVYRIYLSDRKYTSAAQHLEQAIYYDPNSSYFPSTYWNQLGGKVKGYKHRACLWNYVQRNPFDKDRVEDLIEYHSKWGGSPIIALTWLNFFENNFPESDQSFRKGVCYKQLGDAEKAFQMCYGQETSLSNGTLYTSWYDSYRKANFSPSASIADIDSASCSVTIVYPNGAVLKRNDHPITGLISRVELSGMYIQLDYDSAFQISKVSSSDGNVFELVRNSSGELEYVKSVKGDKPTSQILTYVQSVYDFKYISGGSLPLLPVEDPVFNKLNNDFTAKSEDESNKTKKSSKWFVSGNKLLSYLTENFSRNPEYTDLAFATEEKLFDAAKNQPEQSMEGLTAVKSLHKLILATRIRGVDQNTWEMWSTQEDWVFNRIALEKKQENRLQFQNASASFREKPVTLLASAYWIEKSPLSNPSLWKRYSYSEILPKDAQSNATFNCILYRSNGDVVAGSNRGLYILRSGFWESAVYNSNTTSIERYDEGIASKSVNNILGLAEKPDGSLVVATADGMFSCNAGYYGRVANRWMDTDGLPGQKINMLSSAAEMVVAGNTNGASSLEGNAWKKITLPESCKPNFIKLSDGIGESGKEKLCWIGSASGLWLSKRSESGWAAFRKISDAIFTDISWSENFMLAIGKTGSARIVAQDTGYSVSTIVSTPFSDTPPERTEKIRLPGYTNAIHAVLTNRGMSLFNFGHFESFKPHSNASAVTVSALSSQGENISLISNDGVFIFRNSAQQIIENLVVTDMVFLKESDLIVVGQVQGGIGIWDGVKEKYLNIEEGEFRKARVCRESDNSVIINDGDDVYRMSFSRDNGEINYRKKFLFRALCSSSDFQDPERISRLLVDSDHTIWAVNSYSLFRFPAEASSASDVEEYGYFADSRSFPVPTSSIFNIFETLQGEIYVAASNHSHWTYKGVRLSGGLLKWDKSKEAFTKVATNDLQFNTFVNGYYPVDATHAILGTNTGFAWDNNGYIRSFRSMGNPSYLSLLKNHPSLYLGTGAARMGDIMLFGSAAGVVGYYNDYWFYPENINSLLPRDPEFGKRGGRHVYSISSDSKGKILVGTDHGLLIYDNEGTSAHSFLFNNNLSTEALSLFNSTFVHDEASIVLTGLPSGSPTKTLLDQITNKKKEIDRVQNLKQTNNVAVLNTAERKPIRLNNDSLDQSIRNLQNQHFELLLSLEKSDPAVRQLVDIKPVDLASMKNKLKEDQSLVQYIPLEEKLLIQVVRKNNLELIEVVVPRDSLFATAERASSALASRSGKVTRGVITDTDDEKSEYNNKDFIYLYDKLLRPLEGKFTRDEVVTVVPAGPLFYLPYQTLMYNDSKGNVHFAVENFTFSYMSSLQFFDLQNDKSRIAGNSMLLMGDPDGSLPGAREEVARISQIAGAASVFTRATATSQKFQSDSRNRNYVHLATHGKLDSKNPAMSTLLFADRKVLVSEVFSMDFSQANLVTLSACETGRGAKGLEYATLARAFVNAGARNVLATLWEVDDLATRDIMSIFYEKLLKTNASPAVAITQAQREYLLKLDHQDSPCKWAPFVLFGLN